MGMLRIAGGRVVDPANGVNDEVRDLWIENGRVIPAPDDPAIRADRTIDARGYVVMPGGVDVHSHIAGSKVNAGAGDAAGRATGDGGRLATSQWLPVRDDRQRADDVRHRLPVCRARLHDRRRRRDPAAECAAARTPSSATRRSSTRLARVDGQSSRDPRPGPRGRSRALRQTVAWLLGTTRGVRREGRQPWRRRAVEAGQGEARGLGRPGRRTSTSRPGRSPPASPARSTSSACPTRSTCTG